MEAKLEAKLKRKVEALGGQCWKWISGQRGVPDRIIFMPGGFIYFVETKWGKNKEPSPQQKLIHKILARLGIKVYVIITEEQLNDFILCLQQN